MPPPRALACRSAGDECGHPRLPDVALQIAFTYDGLKALGLSEEILRRFSDELLSEWQVMKAARAGWAISVQTIRPAGSGVGQARCRI